MEQLLSGIPVLPLRDVVVYPYMVIPLFVGRERSIQALSASVAGEKQILLLTQKNPNEDQPETADLYVTGTLATVLQLLKLPDGTVKVLVEGMQRAVVHRLVEGEHYVSADIKIVRDVPETSRETEVLVRSLKSQFEQYSKLNRKTPTVSLTGIGDISRLIDTIAAHLTVKIEDKQKILETINLNQRLDVLIGLMESEIDILQAEKRIRGRVERKMKDTQREYYLTEQMNAIKDELRKFEGSESEIESLENKIKNAGMTKEALDKARAEFEKLKMMSPMSAEATVTRNYLDWMVSLPWDKKSELQPDLERADQILESEHYGLEEIKERILEFLAVQSRMEKQKGPILCFVGPPGVGKTSLAQSIANATGRKLVRMSLGGVRDEAEIRGHRRTYIAAMPGKIIQKISKSGVNNAFFLLDEIDKMAMDFRGDPASALLEVLDPEQNFAFNDHYLEVDFDLSDIMFVATANSTSAIPPALLDRMEVIRLSGYTEFEKINIALRHLIPKQVAANGLEAKEINISEKVVRDIIRYYTREAGVRNLERELAKICRKVLREILTAKKIKESKKTKEVKKINKMKKISITPQILEKYLGVRRYRYGIAEVVNQIGQVKGLAWTEVGGELLTIEAMVVPGKGKLIYTGKLGSVMQESIKAAMTVVRSRAVHFGIAKEFFETHDIHIHVPEGATPKDGPSAGIGMCTALVSVITGKAVRADVAMTGEITLRGEVLPIGGLKEKLLAAHRGGIKLVIIPEENRKDLKEIPDNIKEDLEIKPVKWIDDVLMNALVGYSSLLLTARRSSASVSLKRRKKLLKGEIVRAH